jgi:hypothetical protein
MPSITLEAVYGDPLTPLERDAIAAFVSTPGPLMDALRAQLAVCRIKSREFTGVGFFTVVVVPQRLAVPDAGRSVFDGINAEIEGLQYGAGFLLFVEGGMLDMLEGFTYGDDAWPDRIERYTIKSDKEMNEGV